MKYSFNRLAALFLTVLFQIHLLGPDYLSAEETSSNAVQQAKWQKLTKTEP